MSDTLTIPTSVDEVATIADPLERVQAAAAFVARAEERAESARSMRDMAAAVAHLDDGVPPVTLYREHLRCSRGLFVRMIQRAPAQRPKIENAAEVAEEAAGAVRRHDAAIERAREIRDQTALLLMHGGVDEVTGQKVQALSNADVARATGLSTARIAQVRTGTR